MDKNEKKPNSTEAEAGQGGDKQLKLLVFVVLGISLVAPIAASLFTVNAINQNVNSLKPTPTPGETPDGETAPGAHAMVFYDPMEFLVNLSDNEETHYLKTTVSLGLVGNAEEKAAKASGGGHGGGHGGGKAESPLVAQIKPQEPVIRDTIISIISSRKFRELGTLAGKNELKESLRARLKEQLKIEDVAVYFTSFTLQ